MLKATLAIAVPAAAFGIGLAHMSPQERVSLFHGLSSAAGLDTTTTPNAAASPAWEQRPASLAQTAHFGSATAIEPDGFGQFETTMEVSGHTLPVLIDTGASYVALSYEDAAIIGIHPRDADFKYAVQTANGTARAAGAIIPRLRVGNVEATDVPAIVSQPGALTRHSLLGMSFLRKLSGFGVESGRLVLRQ